MIRGMISPIVILAAVTGAVLVGWSNADAMQLLNPPVPGDLHRCPECNLSQLILRDKNWWECEKCGTSHEFGVGKVKGRDGTFSGVTFTPDVE